jgi:hypothetical protein
VEHSFKENHHIVWEEAKILEIEKSSVYRKYKEAAYMSCIQNSIRQLSTEILPIWCPLINEEMSK